MANHLTNAGHQLKRLWAERTLEHFLCWPSFQSLNWASGYGQVVHPSPKTRERVARLTSIALPQSDWKLIFEGFVTEDIVLSTFDYLLALKGIFSYCLWNPLACIFIKSQTNPLAGVSSVLQVLMVCLGGGYSIAHALGEYENDNAGCAPPFYGLLQRSSWYNTALHPTLQFPFLRL